MRKIVLLLMLAALLSCTEETTPITFEQFEAAIEESGVWKGGPETRYEAVGRHSLATAIEVGLLPEHKVLDVGAGSLRVGFWLLQYIEPENYHAIEPNQQMIDMAAEIIGEPIHVYYNSDFEYPDVDFDFVIARSIWTHASKPMIAKMLSEFAENSTDEGRFLASFLPASSEDEDYLGDEWVGSDHEKRGVGIVRHSLQWIEEECARNGLWVEETQTPFNQKWLLIGKTRS